MLKSSSLVVLAAALASSGCTVLGPDFKAPDAPAVSGYAMTGDAATSRASLSPEARPAGPWWNALGSSQLDALIRAALKDSPDIAFAEANLRSALAEAGAASGAQLPQVDLAGNAQRERINTQSFGFVGFPSPTINLYQLGVVGKYDLDIWGKKRRATEAAAARAEADARRADAAYLTLSANVALQAVRIAMLRDQIEIVNEAVKGDNDVIDMIKRAQQAGGAPQSASSIGETQLAQDLAMLPRLERQLAEARHQLALFLGKSPGEWSAPDFNLADFTLPTNVPVTLPSQLVRRRPDILTAESEFHAATADIGVATASLYPDISLSASVTQGTIKPENLFEYGSSSWSVLAGITGPIFHGGTLKANEQRALAEADAKFADYRRTVLRAFVQVSDALSGVAADDKQVAALDRVQAAAQASFDDSRRAYELGAGALLDIYVQGRDLNTAKRQRVEALGQRMTDIINLYAATAGDWK